MQLTYRHTFWACCLGNVVLTVVNFFPPLLFVTFQQEFGLPLAQIGSLAAINFATQTVTDLLAARFIDQIGYRKGAIGANLFACLGLLAMAVLPQTLPDPYVGLVIAIIICGVGGGLVEVLANPIVEAIPGGNKAGNMSILHAFFGWGSAGVILVSTLFFLAFGIEHWRYLLFVWAVLPLLDLLLFCRVPIRSLAEDTPPAPFRKLFGVKIFLFFLLMMVCGGAAEMAVCQWASYFAESGLQVNKTVGDLLGACGFAALMAACRTYYGTKASFPIRKTLLHGSLLCIASYLILIFAPHPLLSLLGCAICGWSVGMLWPGLFSLAAIHYPQGGTAMFALMALAGDLGCSAGPGLVGLVSQKAAAVQGLAAAGSAAGLKAGFLVAIVFPVAVALGMAALGKRKQEAA